MSSPVETRNLEPVQVKVYHNYEICPCRRLNDAGEPDPNGLSFEVCEPHEAHVWTLYGHIPGEGVMAIGDFATREGAEEAFQRITGIPFGSHEEVEARLRVMHASHRLLETIEKAHSRLLWARDLAEKAANLVMLDNPSGAQELLDEIASSEYANDDLDAITDAIAEATGRAA